VVYSLVGKRERESDRRISWEAKNSPPLTSLGPTPSVKSRHAMLALWRLHLSDLSLFHPFAICMLSWLHGGGEVGQQRVGVVPITTSPRFYVSCIYVELRVCSDRLSFGILHLYQVRRVFWWRSVERTIHKGRTYYNYFVPPTLCDSGRHCPPNRVESEEKSIQSVQFSKMYFPIHPSGRRHIFCKKRGNCKLLTTF
jgi:hypothetical protein